MQSQPNTSTQNCPPTAKAVLADACKLFKEILHFCQSSDHTFKQVETELLKRLFALGCCLLRLFLASRHDRLDIQPYLQDRSFRPGQRDAERTLFTCAQPNSDRTRNQINAVRVRPQFWARLPNSREFWRNPLERISFLDKRTHARRGGSDVPNRRGCGSLALL